MIHRIFNDFDAFTDAIEDADLCVSLRQLDLPQWSIRHVHLDSLHVQSGSEGGGNIAEGATRRDGWVLYFQTKGAWHLANGERLQSDAVMLMGPGAEFCMASQDAHDWISVFVPTTSLFPTSCVGPVTPSGMGQVVRPGRWLTDRLRAVACGLIASAEVEPSVATEAASVACMSEELVNIARRIVRVPSSPIETDRLAINRYQLVSLAAELVEECPEVVPTVSELARKADVSERTLRNAFAQYLGVSPYKYLAVRRLNHARQLLLESEPVELTVCAAAAKVGFWDFGRFSEKYRKLFGELPSETLHRRRMSA